ncbi:hypothetical protein K458DRAFT_412525 [Lentithecium fluviatile CBS 122367]|uniref:WD40 repeat-like protein n=1 Tax=Lentithecium fluviatile CBS 122367 TaxID=1168545 RepID=A0A6G1JLW6_9PLEO|nr:hypothetical protein K458DRAFT_412525 [Lentithecium fluviatile CBS 122367]
MAGVGIQVKVLKSTSITAEDVVGRSATAKDGKSDDFRGGEVDEDRGDGLVPLGVRVSIGLAEESSQKAYETHADSSNPEDEDMSDAGTEVTGDDSGDSSSSDGSVESILEALKPQEEKHVSCIQEAQLSPDGKCIFTRDYERTFSVYAVGSDIFEGQMTRPLKPWARFVSADPIWSFAVDPRFDANDGGFTTVLISRRDQYISLHNALWDTSRDYSAEEDASTTEPVNISYKRASYRLVNPLTEKVDAPLSLAYSRDGTSFYAGHQDSISVFDIECPGYPKGKIRTIPSARSTLKGGGIGFKGHITSLALSPSSALSRTGVLAAGARTRFVGLYDPKRCEEITHIELPGKNQRTSMPCAGVEGYNGNGNCEVHWSPNGNYLYIAERDSDAILIYDARKFSLALGRCAGRAALTKQRMGFDVFSYGGMSDDHEIWAGGVDGKIRYWKNPHLREGAVEADEVIQASDGPVTSTLIHKSGSLAVAASGSYEYPGVDGDEMTRGKRRGGGHNPRYTEWGCLSILGLGN